MNACPICGDLIQEVAANEAQAWLQHHLRKTFVDRHVFHIFVSVASTVFGWVVARQAMKALS